MNWLFICLTIIWSFIIWIISIIAKLSFNFNYIIVESWDSIIITSTRPSAVRPAVGKVSAPTSTTSKSYSYHMKYYMSYFMNYC